MSHRIEWTRRLLEDEMRRMAEHGLKWLSSQPAGWAREGATGRLEKIMRTRLEREVGKQLKLRDYVPPELSSASNWNRRAYRAFCRLVGPKPDSCYVDQWSTDRNVRTSQYIITTRVMFVCEEKMTGMFQADLDVPVYKRGRLIESAVETTFRAEERYAVDGEFAISNEAMEDL